MAPTRPVDPWGQVDDLEGTALYSTLELDPRATSDEIKKAYRTLARKLHPDKGGDQVAFTRLQAAFEVLSDPDKRQVYDNWAKQLEFRYVRTGAAAGGAGMGGEDVLLDEFENLGLKCDPATQLVVTCEVCRRPATKECWTCGMQICEFCTLKRHWKGRFPLHWPLVNKAHMLEKLGQKELEGKREEDARRLALEDPNHRTEAELQDIRDFKEAAQAALQLEDRTRRFHPRLARYYMWAQTDATVWLACRVPCGYGDRELVVEVRGRGLLVQSEDSPPLIERELAGAVDQTRPVDIYKPPDNRVCVLGLPKAELGQDWPRLFEGDTDGVRCMKPPYTLSQGEDDVLLEVELPFWIDPEDVCVRFGPRELLVGVRNTLHLRRTYWRNIEYDERMPDYSVLDLPRCAWSLEDEKGPGGRRYRTLLLTMPRPPPTQEEIEYKKGVRQDNRAAGRPEDRLVKKGFRFFAEDEDHYQLEDMLQAVCFIEAGRTFVPTKPWELLRESVWVSQLHLLPADVQDLVASFKAQAAADAAEGKDTAQRGAQTAGCA